MVENFPGRPEPPLTIGVSECLLGAAVRYDGTDSKSEFPHETLAGLFNYLGICPEVGIGLGVPRPPVQLVLRDESVRVTGVSDPHLDVTDRLSEFARQQAPRLDCVAGYVFMKNSPSCGLHGVKIFSSLATGRGIYAKAIVERYPNLPVEENDRLSDPDIRACFVVRVFAYAHWQMMMRSGLTATEGLREFHERYECLLLARGIDHLQSARALVDRFDGSLSAADEYLRNLMMALSHPESVEGHVRVLRVLLDRMKKHIDVADYQGFERLISAYRCGESPLTTLLSLLKSYQHPDSYLSSQVYLSPLTPAARPTA